MHTAQGILHAAGVGDLERMVARLHCTSRGVCARDAVVLYEDAARRRVAALVAALRGLQAVAAALGSFPQPPASAALRALACKGAARSLAEPLEELAGAADWEAAKAEGRVVPRPVSAGATSLLHRRLCGTLLRLLVYTMAPCMDGHAHRGISWHRGLRGLLGRARMQLLMQRRLR